MAEAPDDGTLRRVAEQVSDSLWQIGYAFLEEDHIDALAGSLRSFLASNGIPTAVTGADYSDARGAPTA